VTVSIVVPFAFDTWSGPKGLAVPTPTCPLELTKRAEVPVDVATFITAPDPSCWTLKPVVDVFEYTSVLLELMSVGTLGLPWLNVLIYS